MSDNIIIRPGNRQCNTSICIELQFTKSSQQYMVDSNLAEVAAYEILAEVARKRIHERR